MDTLYALNVTWWKPVRIPCIIIWRSTWRNSTTYAKRVKRGSFRSRRWTFIFVRSILNWRQIRKKIRSFPVRLKHAISERWQREIVWFTAFVFTFRKRWNSSWRLIKKRRAFRVQNAPLSFNPAARSITTVKTASKPRRISSSKNYRKLASKWQAHNKQTIFLFKVPIIPSIDLGYYTYDVIHCIDRRGAATTNVM